MFFLTLLMTGIKNTKETNKEQDAAISKYKKICILVCLLSSLCSIIAVVDVLSDLSTEFKQF